MSPDVFMRRLQRRNTSSTGDSFSILTTQWLLNLLLARRGRIHALLADDEKPLHGFLDDMGAMVSDDFEIGQVQRLLDERAARLQAARIRPGGRFARNLEQLRDRLGLTRLERDILGFVVVMRSDPNARNLIDALYPQATHQAIVEAVSLGLGAQSRDVGTCLQPHRILRRASLLGIRQSFSMAFSLRVDIRSGLVDALSAEKLNLHDLLQDAMYPARASRLDWADFAHMNREAELIRGQLAHAYADSATGSAEGGKETGRCNILLAGPPGTGKSELARLLARELDADAWEIAELEPGDDTRSRTFDMSLAQEILARARRPLIIFDEIEDVFGRDMDLGNRDQADHSKGWMNRFLESNPVPTIWITNSVDRIDRAHLRRFDMVIDMPPPTRTVKRRLVHQQLPAHLAEGRLGRHLIQSSEITAVDVGMLARACDSLGEGTDRVATEETMERLLDHRLRVLRGSRYRPERQSSDGYKLRWLNPDADIGPIAEGLKRSRMGRILLHGPPGTGKTAFAGYLSRELDCPLIRKSYSQLVSCWLGESEKNIRHLFEEATREGAVLMLDEADSLLRDRQAARASWEVSQTNEILQQMEDFDGIFIAATNRMEQIEPAAMRRFDWHLALDWLRPEQVLGLARETLIRCGSPAPTADQVRALERISPVAPGDFRVAERQAEVLGQPFTADTLIEILGGEASRRNTDWDGIGFLARVS